LVATPLVVLSTRPETDVGTPPWAGSSRRGRDVARPTPTGAVAAIVVRSARLAHLDQVPSPRPVQLTIPGIGVDAPVIRLGVESSGALEVPGNVASVGWYRFGPSPGEPGSALIAGHVDSRVEGPGVFFDLSRLRPGDSVQVELQGGDRAAFEVVSRSLVAKDRLPPAIFSRGGDPSLTLITCGGSFDQEAGHYLQNVIVTAVPRQSPGLAR
jgi:LPXTG-site transpeptidase (sortase) family protein